MNRKNLLANLICIAFILGAFAITAFGQDERSGPTEDDINRAVALAEANSEEAQPGSFVYRDADGNERVLNNVVHSTQYQAMIEEQKKIREALVKIQDGVDYLVSQRATEPDIQEPADAITIDVNTAGLAELVKIPGIATSRGGAILAERGSPGIPGYSPFEDFVDLARRIKGIGGGTVEDMKSDPGIIVIFSQPEPPAEDNP